MNALKFVVPGEPKGKGRPRFTRAGHTYTLDATRAYEAKIQEAAREAMHGFPPVAKEVAFEVNVEAFFPIPKSWSKKKRLSALQGVDRPIKKPDIDNVVKSAVDGMNGIVFVDDAQVVKLTATKHYSETPRLEVTVRELEEA